MFIFLLQSLTSLLLAGVLVYAVFTSNRLQNRIRTQQILLGLGFGLTAIALGSNIIFLDPVRVPLDAKAGPLVFAGMLGGPIGAVIAGLCAALFRLSLGGHAPFFGAFMNLAIVAVGLLVSFLRPLPNWPTISKTAVLHLLVTFVLLHILVMLYLTKFSTSPDWFSEAVSNGIAFTAVGIFSILATWQILNRAYRFARESNRSAELAKKLDLAMHVSNIGMFVHEAGEAELYFDAGMMEIYQLGKEPRMMAVSDWVKMLHPDDLPQEKQMMQRVWAGEIPKARSDFRAYRPDGTMRYIRVNLFTETGADGKVIRVTGTNTDLTDIREAEQQNKAFRERLASIVEKLPGTLVEVDYTDRTNPKLIYVSPKCQDIWAAPDTDFYADPTLFSQMHDPEDNEVFRTLLMECIETGTPIFHRYKVNARDGKTRWVDYHGSSSHEDGKVRIQAIVLEATKEVEAQEQVEDERGISRRAQKLESIGKLTGGVAHDFNNVLAVILGSLELLRDDDEPSKQIKLIDNAITATLRGADLTKNMLAFARKAPLTPVVVELNNVVREAKNWMARTLPDSIVVETSLLAGLWPVEVDRSSLESALLNLTLNARDAMEGHGNLTIETANVRIDEAYIDSRREELAPGRYVMLAVSDTGPGIPEDILISVFEPFFTTKPPGVGSGLGLSMTVGFMRQSGGTVQVYTEVGEGTTFKLYFPATTAQPDQTAPAISTDKNAALGGQRLLLAEDEDAVRETLVTMLERAGYQVTQTASGDEAFAVFEADPTFDVLLTDIVMPGKLQGTSLAKALRERWPALPVLFMSGYASEATVHGNGLRPEDIRLMKPVQRQELLAAVAKVVSKLKR